MSAPNIYLIGLPGAGKTTLAHALSLRLNKTYLDIDESLKKEHGKSVKELFNMGESYFRSLESDFLLKLDHENTVVSTGGGIVLSETNRHFLKKQNFVIYINRSIQGILDTLDTADRPLFSKGTDVLLDLYQFRHRLYQECATIEIDNNQTIENSVDEIVKWLVKENYENTNN